jgi:GH43 family beta-xylosidase
MVKRENLLGQTSFQQEGDSALLVGSLNETDIDQNGSRVALDLASPVTGLVHYREITPLPEKTSEKLFVPFTGADPFCFKHRGLFWLLLEEEGQFVLRWADQPSDLGQDAEKVVIWIQAEGKRNPWAPEAHFLQDKSGIWRWYIYYCTTAVEGDYKGQRLKALVSAGDDPRGPYAEVELRGYDSLAESWGIDMTVAIINGKLYAFFSGAEPDGSDDMQDIRAVEMDDPLTMRGEPRILFEPTNFLNCSERPILEGPQTFSYQGRTFMVMSADASWTEHYCLVAAELKSGCDPLDPESWQKMPSPVFNQEIAGVPGPGHASLFEDDGKLFMMSHFITDLKEGWKSRKVGLWQVIIPPVGADDRTWEFISLSEMPLIEQPLS